MRRGSFVSPRALRRHVSRETNGGMGGLLCSRRSIDKDVLADRVAVDIYKLCKKEKRLLQQEWPRLLAYNPNIFRNAWMKTVHRSSSIKRTLGIVTDEEAPRNRCLIRLSTVVESFFSRIVATVTYDQPAVEEACKQLGASHRQYKSRGFQAIFWDIFMLSLMDAIELSTTEYLSGSARLRMLHTCQKFIHGIVEQLRVGYFEEPTPVVPRLPKLSVTESALIKDRTSQFSCE